MRFIDTHAHIHDSEFEGDVAGAIERAAAAGVERVVTLGTNLDSSRRAIALAEADERVLATAGVHPHDAAEASERDLDELEEMAGHRRVAMVGEIGLDFYRDLSPRDDQLRALRHQLETARRVQKPIAVHTREAADAMMPLLREHSERSGGSLPGGRPLGVMHYFSGDAALARTCVDLGFLISIHTSVTHPRAGILRQVARDIDLAHLVIETDSPYGAPQAHRGRRNEPAFVVEAAKAIAAVRGVTLADIAAATTSNAQHLLGITVAAGEAA